MKKTDEYYYQNPNSHRYDKQEKSLLKNLTMISLNVNTNNSNNNLSDLTNMVHKKVPSNLVNIESNYLRLTKEISDIFFELKEKIDNV